jgi:hypothetical protein
MSLRPFTAAWSAEPDVAPWIPPATTATALLLGATATMLLAHGRAAQLRFNVRASRALAQRSARADAPRTQPAAGFAAAAAACACAAALARDSALLALPLPPGALAAVAPQSVRAWRSGAFTLQFLTRALTRFPAAPQLPGLALCSAALAAFATLAFLLLSAPKRRSTGSRATAPAKKRGAAPAPASPRGRGVAASDSFSFGAAAAEAATTPKLGAKAKAATEFASGRKKAQPAKRAPPAASPEPRAAPEPAVSPVASPTRGRPATAKKGTSLIRCSFAHCARISLPCAMRCLIRRVPWLGADTLAPSSRAQLLRCALRAPRGVRLRRRRLLTWRRPSRSSPPPDSQAREARAPERAGREGRAAAIRAAEGIRRRREKMRALFLRWRRRLPRPALFNDIHVMMRRLRAVSVPCFARLSA